MHYHVTPIKPFGILIESLSDDYSVDNLSISLLRRYFVEEKLIVLRGFKTFTTSDSFAQYCERFGEISVWPFGRVLELKKQDIPADHIFDNSYVPLHWDGMYRPVIPEYQIFHCVDAPGKAHGGRTVFSNTSIVLDKSPVEWVEQWKKITVRYTRKMEFYDSTTISPIVVKHPYRNKWIIRYNEPPSKDIPHFINPPDIQFLNVNEPQREELILTLNESLYGENALYAHEWCSHDIVIADNFTLLHGREAYMENAARHLQRVHVNSTPVFKNPGLESYR